MRLRIFAICIVFIFVLSPAGCTNTVNSKDDLAQWESSMFNRFTSTDGDLADELLESIVETIQTQDSAALRSLFSDSAVQSADNLDAQIQLLFELYEGEMVSFKRYGPGSYSSKEGSTYLKEIEASFDIVTSSNTYRMAIKLCTVDSVNPDNVGLLSIYIIEAADSDGNFAYWGDGNWMPGITIESGGDSD